MSAYRFVTLTCDECGEIFDDGQSVGIRECRTNAAAENWRYDRTRGDTCPKHNGWVLINGHYHQETPL